jgi:hypothetical protein
MNTLTHTPPIMRMPLLFGLCTLAVCLAMTPVLGTEPPTAVCRVETDAKLAQIPFLSWDTEGGNRAQTNLLRAPVELRLRGAERWIGSKELPARRFLYPTLNAIREP